MFFISQALAQDIPVDITDPSLGNVAPPPGDPLMMNVILIGGLFILFYFLMIRPQSKRLKEQKQMLDALKKGDEVVTSGGIIGKITKLIDDHEIEVEISKGVTIKVLRYTIQQRKDYQKADTSKASAKEEAKPANDKKPVAAKKAPAKKAGSKKATSKKAAK